MILEVSFFTSVKTVRKNRWERRIKRRRLACVASFLRAIREERGIHVVRENHRPVEPQDRQNDVVAILLVHHHLLLGVDPDVAGVDTEARHELFLEIVQGTVVLREVGQVRHIHLHRLAIVKENVHDLSVLVHGAPTVPSFGTLSACFRVETLIELDRDSRTVGHGFHRVDRDL